MAMSAAAKQKLKDKVKKAAQLSLENTKYKPGDYLKGDKNVGKKYTAWETYSGETPDLGSKKGPGDPYHEVTKTIPSRSKAKADYSQRMLEKRAADRLALRKKTSEKYYTPPTGYEKAPASNNYSKTNADFRTDAIRRRLQGVK